MDGDGGGDGEGDEDRKEEKLNTFYTATTKDRDDDTIKREEKNQ